MLRRQFVVTCLALVGSVALSSLPVHAGGPKATESLINLTPAPGLGSLKGKAKSKVKPGEKEFAVEVNNARAFAGATLTVFVNGATAGTIAVTPLGGGKLSLNSKLGATVPVISAGSTVVVKDGFGNAILSGSF